MLKIVKVEVAGEETKERLGVGRAVIGGLLLGPAGAVIGAMSKKDKGWTYFRVTYSSGKTDVVKYKNGSMAYKQMMRLAMKGGN